MSEAVIVHIEIEAAGVVDVHAVEIGQLSRIVGLAARAAAAHVDGEDPKATLDALADALDAVGLLPPPPQPDSAPSPTEAILGDPALRERWIALATVIHERSARTLNRIDASTASGRPDVEAVARMVVEELRASDDDWGPATRSALAGLWGEDVQTSHDGDPLGRRRSPAFKALRLAWLVVRGRVAEVPGHERDLLDAAHRGSLPDVTDPIPGRDGDVEAVGFLMAVRHGGKRAETAAKCMAMTATAHVTHVASARAPVAARLRKPHGGWLDVRVMDGVTIRPVLAPGKDWRPVGLPEFAALSAGGLAWPDCPFRIKPHPRAAHLDMLDYASPVLAGEGREAAARAATAALAVAGALVVVDGIVHRSTSPPTLHLTMMGRASGWSMPSWKRKGMAVGKPWRHLRTGWRLPGDIDAFFPNTTTRHSFPDVVWDPGVPNSVRYSENPSLTEFDRFGHPASAADDFARFVAHYVQGNDTPEIGRALVDVDPPIVVVDASLLRSCGDVHADILERWAPAEDRSDDPADPGRSILYDHGAIQRLGDALRALHAAPEGDDAVEALRGWAADEAATGPWRRDEIAWERMALTALARCLADELEARLVADRDLTAMRP